MSTGELIKKIREDIGMTQEEFADAIHCKQSVVSKFERNSAKPSTKTVKLIFNLAKSKKIKVKLEDLL